MELNNLIKELIDSRIVENQELALNLLTTDRLTDVEKRKHIDKFIEDYTSGRVNFFTEEQQNVFKGWVEIYKKTIKDEVKNRIKKIE